MSKLAPITSRAKMNGGIIKGKSSCGCGGGCGCSSSPAKQTEKSGANVPAKPGANVSAKPAKEAPATRDQIYRMLRESSKASDKYPLVRGGAPQVQEFRSGALEALWGGGAGAALAMKAAFNLTKGPKTAKIANSIQNFFKGSTKAKTSSNIRADGFGGRTTVGSRPNYNNRGSN